MKTDALLHQAFERLDVDGIRGGVADNAARIEALERVPEDRPFDPFVGDLPEPAGRQPLDAVEKAVAGIAILPGEADRYLARVDIAAEPVTGENCLVLRGEQDALRGFGHRHRLDAEAVARQPELGAAQIDIGEREHAVEQRHGLARPPVVQRLQHDLGVGCGVEDDAFGAQVVAQRLEIVDLAIEDQHALAILNLHGLTGVTGGVDDGQALVAEGKPAIVPAAAVVGTAMHDRPHHVRDIRQVRLANRTALAPDPCNSAHALQLPRRHTKAYRVVVVTLHAQDRILAKRTSGVPERARRC